MSLITLGWLPEAPDWRARAKAFQTGNAPTWAEAAALARCRIGFSQTNALDGLTTAALTSGLMVDAPQVCLRLALVGSSTLTHLQAGVRVAGLRRGLRVETMEAEFGQSAQAVLDPSSSLHAFAPDAVVFAFDAPHLTQGLASGMTPMETHDRIEAALENVVALWRAVRDRLGASVIQQTVLPTVPTVLGQNEHRLATSGAEAMRRINARLRELADIEGVDILALDQVAADDGLDAWHSRGQWLRARQDVAPQASPAYGELVMRLVAARRGLSAKCLVLDLDNTLWGGVIGDDGLAGIVLGAGSGEGEAFRDIQAYALALARRGVILAVSSKNDEAVVVEAFDTHPEMLIRRSDIACLRANWDDKPSNLTAIAETLNIGLESLVFLDDNPVERDLVRRTLPGVQVPEWPGDPARVPRLLAEAGYFESVGVTEEDRSRAGLYAARADSVAAKAQATDLAGYLQGLEMRLVWSPVDEIGLTRAAQLINKTNQFNLTGRRYSEAEVRRLMADPEIVLLQFRLIDRFVDNGIIAIVVARREWAATLTIDTWLMSCRVLGREVEKAVLAVLAEAARARGVEHLVGEHVETERNGLVRDLYPRLGFDPLSGPGSRFTLDLTRYEADAAAIQIQRADP